MDRPIIFSAPMVRALLAGRKTQTRRILKPQPPTPEQFPGSCFGLDRAVADGVKVYSLNDLDRLPKHPTKWDLCGSVGVARNAGFPMTYRVPFTVGDRLWVRENCQAVEQASGEDGVHFPADEAWEPIQTGSRGAADDWVTLNHYGNRRGAVVPSIHMPRWASRLTLLVTDVRVERLNAISHADAIAEGCKVIRDHCFVFEGTGYDLNGLCHSSAVTAFNILWDDIHGADAWSANPWVVAVSFQPFQTNIDRMPERPAAPVPAAAE